MRKMNAKNIAQGLYPGFAFGIMRESLWWPSQRDWAKHNRERLEHDMEMTKQWTDTFRKEIESFQDTIGAFDKGEDRKSVV